MASGTRRTNTFSEALNQAAQDFSSMKGMPDADIPWVVEEETRIYAKIRESFASAGVNGELMAPDVDPNAMPMGGAPGGMPPMPPMPTGPDTMGGMGTMLPPPPMNGPSPIAPGTGTPSPDELRRILQQQ